MAGVRGPRYSGAASGSVGNGAPIAWACWMRTGTPECALQHALLRGDVVLIGRTADRLAISRSELATHRPQEPKLCVAERGLDTVRLRGDVLDIDQQLEQVPDWACRELPQRSKL